MSKKLLSNIYSIRKSTKWQIKRYPLQIAIKILKRHRDIHFEDNPDDKPISIIVTTLAALAYQGQPDVYDTLQSIVQEMPKYIERRDGWWVANPVDDENFADKLNEYPERREAFINWLIKVQEDFNKASKYQTFSEMTKSLTPALGHKTMEKVANELRVSWGQQGSTSIVVTKPSVPVLGDAKHCRIPTWHEKIQYKVELKCSVHIKQGGKKLWI